MLPNIPDSLRLLRRAAARRDRRADNVLNKKREVAFLLREAAHGHLRHGGDARARRGRGGRAGATCVRLTVGGSRRDRRGGRRVARTAARTRRAPLTSGTPAPEGRRGEPTSRATPRSAPPCSASAARAWCRRARALPAFGQTSARNAMSLGASRGCCPLRPRAGARCSTRTAAARRRRPDHVRPATAPTASPPASPLLPAGWRAPAPCRAEARSHGRCSRVRSRPRPSPFNKPGEPARSTRSGPRSRTRRCARRRRGPRRPAGRAGRDPDPRPRRDEGLLEPARGDGAHAARRLDAHRRPRHGRRGRLLLHRRPDQGHDHPRRAQRVPAGGRGRPARAPGRRHAAVVRVPHPVLGEEGGAAIVLRDGPRRRRRSCAASSATRSPPTSTPGTSGSSTRCRWTPWASPQARIAVPPGSSSGRRRAVVAARLLAGHRRHPLDGRRPAARPPLSRRCGPRRPRSAPARAAAGRRGSA